MTTTRPSHRAAPERTLRGVLDVGAAIRHRAARLWILGASCLAGCAATVPPPKPPVVIVPPEPPPPAPEAELRLELSEEEKAALSAQAARDLDETERLIGGLDRARLTAEELEKLQTVESLVAAAKAAEEKGDIPGRANLARKARLLAEELVPD